MTVCGRYAIAPTRADAWAPVGEVLGPRIESSLAALQARFNVAPTQQVPIVIQGRQTRELRAVLARWGFIPAWWSRDKPPVSTINARSEEAEGKPMWRDAWRSSRCLIPATHWYEWQEAAGGNIPHAHCLAGDYGFMFAGLCSQRAGPGAEPAWTCAILTRDASPSLAALHDRMPAILHPGQWLLWLDPQITDATLVRDILRKHTVEEARSWRVSRAVNAARNEGPDLLQQAPDW